MLTNKRIIKSDLNTLKQIYTSKTFIAKIFGIESKKTITVDNELIHIHKKYTIEDLQNMFTLSEYIKTNILPNIKNLTIELNIIQSIIYSSDELLIIKYVSTIDKPNYVKNMVADQSTVYYIKINPTTYNKELLIVNHIRKFVPSCDEDTYTDDDVINGENILNINNEYNHIQFNQGLLMTVNALLGQETVNDIIIPFLYKIFDDFIDNILNKRIKNYLRKNNIEVYTKNKKKKKKEENELVENLIN